MNTKQARQILLLKEDPTYEENRYAYRKLALELHPDKNEKIYHVTFKNGTKTKIHFHDGGQTLIVTKGAGNLSLYRKFGKNNSNFKIKKTKSVTLKIGDCVYVPAKKLHSHGSTNKKADFSHIAINSFPKNNVEPKTIWYESDFKSYVTKRLK